MVTAETHAPMQTQLVLPIEKFPFLVLANDAMLHLIRVVFN